MYYNEANAMGSKLPCRVLSVIFRRRFIRLALLVIFLSVSICLMVKLQKVSLGSSLESVAAMYDVSLPPPPRVSIDATRRVTGDSTDLETRKARERFANIGVNLVQEDTIQYLRSFLLNDSDVLFMRSFNGSSRTNDLDEPMKPATHLNGVDVENYDSFGRKGVGVHSTSSTTGSDKRRTTNELPKHVLLVILVISKPSNVLLRQAARKTWAKDAHYFGVLVRFVVGRLEGWDEIIDRERSIHPDMIVLEDQDTYEALPHKVLEGFRWALKQPSKPSYVMKTDDDTIVNLPYLVSELFASSINSTQILGAICRNSPVVRDQGDKWAVSFLDFPFPTYPPYASGGGYVMSSKCANALLDAKSSTLDWIHLEDVYVTGILARKSGISHLSHEGFAHWTSAKAKPCDFMQRRRITSVNNSEKDFFSMYEGIQDILRSSQPDSLCGVVAKSRTK